MASYLRPMLAFGNWAGDNHGYYGINSLVRWRNRELLTRSRTPWIRTWVLWPYLQPRGPERIPHENNVDTLPNVAATIDPDNPENYPVWQGMTPQIYVQQLDDTIIQAKRAGLRVILTFYMTPYWANRARRTGGGGGSVWHCPPDSAAPGSAWANAFSYICTRYSRLNGSAGGGYRWVDFVETANEPNNQWWPQSDTANTDRGVSKLSSLAAQQMATARGITRGTSNEPLIVGPGMSDSSRTGVTPWNTFMDDMLAWFRAHGFVEDRFIAWSHHNYRDIEVGKTGTNNSTHATRNKLRGYQSLSTEPGVGWRGWGGSSSQTGYTLVTEGGARLNVSEVNQDGGVQASKVSAEWDRLHSGTEGAEIGSICNYLLWSDTQYDCGLCPNVDYRNLYAGRDYALPEPVQRTVFNTWRNKPTDLDRQANIVGFREWVRMDGGFSSGPDACSMREGHLGVFAVGNDQQLWRNERFFGGGWSGWQPMGGYCTSDPTCVSWADNRIDAFVRGSDNNIWRAYRDPGGVWRGYWSIGSPPGGAASSPDVLSHRPGQLEVFVRGTDNQLWHNWMYDYNEWNWSGWYPMGGPIANDPGAISWGTDRMDVFATNPNGSSLRWWWWQASSGWHGPTEIPGPRILDYSSDHFKTQPVVVGGADASSWEPGQMEIYCRGNDSYSEGVFNIWRSEYVPSNNPPYFTGWEWVGGPRPGGGRANCNSEPAAVSYGGRRTDLFVRGSDGSMWTTYQHSP